MTEPAEDIQSAPEGAAPDVANDSADPAARIAALEAQVKELKEQGLRYLAEMENVRKRAQKERDDAGKYAVAGFARELLEVADNFERAAASAPQDGMSDAVKNLVTGIEATGRQLAAALERAGIKKVEALGQLFDPNFHQVMMEIDDAEKPAGTVVQVLQPGYVIHGRLLREARVAVSKGGAAAGKMDTVA
ncbi:MAG: nucleotide exchange factor GrpE [Alphaproteobacteria bacterium]